MADNEQAKENILSNLKGKSAKYKLYWSKCLFYFSMGNMEKAEEFKQKMKEEEKKKL